MKLCRKLWVFFQWYRWPWIPTNREICFEDSDLLTCFCQPMESRGFKAALSSAWNLCWVFGTSGILFHTAIIFLGQATSLFCTCHCCFCFACLYSPIFHFNLCLGTSVMRWCSCCRTEALSPCPLAALPWGQCTDLTTEGKRQRAVNNLKCIWTFAFSGSLPFVEMVQLQTDILP